MIQIHGEGFDVFLNKKHIARLEHRRQIPERKPGDKKISLFFLNFPATDDYNRKFFGSCSVLCSAVTRPFQI
jgi:hypothetical protein